MFRIEPCCARRHLLHLRNAIGTHGTADFEGYEDMSLTELLPALLLRYDDVEMVIVAPSLPDQAAEVIRECMRKAWARMDGKGSIDVIRRLTVIADLSEERSPLASSWLERNPFGERLSLVDRRQEDTVILLPDIAIYGPVNLRYGRRFTATATTVPEMVDRLWARYRSLAVTATEPEAAPEDAATKKEEPETQAPRKSSKKKKRA